MGAADPFSGPAAAEPDAGSVVLALARELDLAVASDTRRLVELELSFGHDVTLELEALEFIDCTGVAALLGANRHAQEVNRRLRLTGPTQAQVRQILALTGTEEILALADG